MSIQRLCVAAAASFALLASSSAAASTSARTYIDGTGVTHSALTGTNGSVDFPALTLVDINGNSIGPGNPLATTPQVFTPNGSYASLSVGASSSEVALPIGSVVAVYNVGAQPAAVRLGTSSSVTATSLAADQVPAGGAIAMTVGSNTYIAATEAANAAGSTTLVISGGAGALSFGGGGGSGGGVGGTVTIGAGAAMIGAVAQSGSWNVTAGLGATDTANLAAVANGVGAQGTGSTFSPPTGGFGQLGYLSGIYKAITGTLPVSISSTVPVSGTFFQATQPVSAISLPLPSGAAQDGADGSGITPPTSGSGIRGWLSGIYKAVTGTLTVSVTGTVPVSGTFWPATQPISAVSLPLPSGAAQDGTDATGIAAPPGGAGLRGWLSGIYNRLGGTLSVTRQATTTGGSLVWTAAGGTSNALLTNSTVAPAPGAHTLYGVSFVNPSSTAAAYVQIFDATSGVTLGTTAPKLSFWVPMGGAWEEKFGPVGLAFSSGITVAATATATGGGAPTAAVQAALYYQ